MFLNPKSQVPRASPCGPECIVPESPSQDKAIVGTRFLGKGGGVQAQGGVTRSFLCSK